MELMEVSPRIAFHRIHRIDIRIAVIESCHVIKSVQYQRPRRVIKL